jgi:hypothetical protein
MALEDGDLLGDRIDEDELAAGLDISPRTAARWRRAGRGPPFVMIGRKPHYSKKSFQQWLIDREVDCSKRPSKRR